MTQITGWVGFDEPPPSLKVKFLPLRDPNGQEMESFRSQSARVAAVLCDTYASPVKMANVEAPVAVVYDGALDNLKRLQSALAEIGEGSSRSTAPEIVLRGYMSWGGAVVGWLQGPFALALWDGRGDGRLLLARDPLGLKPLYYWEDLGRGLRFASNLKTLLTLDVPREIDPIALSSYLEHGHPSPRQSLIQGCRQVLPGHLLIWEKGRLSESASGDGPENLFLSAPARMSDPSLQAWLTDTVLKQLAPDVPVGVLLSGGVKSDLLLSITSSLLGKRVHTFTALCGPVNFPESENARRTALSLGCRHHPLIISPRAGRLLPFIVSHMDEPLADPSALTSYVVCRWASEEVRLLLAGEGPEDFWSPYPAELGSAKPVLARLLADFFKTISPQALFQEEKKTWWTGSTLSRWHQMSTVTSVDIRLPFVEMNRPLLSGSRAGSSIPRAPRRRIPPFPLPIDEWLRSEWRVLVQEVLLDDRTRQRGLTDSLTVERLLQEQLAGRAQHGGRLYQLLVLELWARCILDQSEATSMPGGIDDCLREAAPQRPVRHLAVLAPAGIGDTMRLTPGLKQLGISDPNVSVTLYVHAGQESDAVMSGLPPIDRHVPIDFSKKSGVVWLIKELRRYAPDLLVSTWVSRLAGLVGLLSGVRERHGWLPRWFLEKGFNGFFWTRKIIYDPSQRDAGRYDTEAFSRLLGLSPPYCIAPIMAPAIWSEKGLQLAMQHLGRLPKPILAVNAVAQSWIRQREYPLALMAQALQKLLGKGVIKSIVLVGDAHSGACHQPIVEALGSTSLDLADKLSLNATFTVISKCDAVLTIDGGLLHVALATDRPIIALFGPTEIYPTDPRGENGRFQAISAFDKCRCLCLNHRGIKARPECLGQAQCLAALPPNLIVNAVSHLFSHSPLNSKPLTSDLKSKSKPDRNAGRHPDTSR